MTKQNSFQEQGLTFKNQSMLFTIWKEGRNPSDDLNGFKKAFDKISMHS